MRENSRGFSKIDEETLKYYAEIDAHFKTIEDDEEKHLLAENVLAETAGREADIVPDAACSRVLESLLPFASPSSLEKFTQNCIGGDNLGIICTRWVSNIRFYFCLLIKRNIDLLVTTKFDAVVHSAPMY